MAILNNEVLQAANFNIPQSATWFATTTGATPDPLQINLPGPGTYLLTVDLWSYAEVTGAGGYIRAALFDTNAGPLTSTVIGGVTYWEPNGADILANSNRMIWLDPSGSGDVHNETSSFTVLYTTTETTPVVCLCVYRGDTGTNFWVASTIYSASNGYSRISYVQLAPAPVTFENSATFDSNVAFDTNVTITGILTANGITSFAGDVTCNATTTFNGITEINSSVQVSDGSNFAIGSSSGTQFGSTSNAKLGFLGATPASQQTGGVKTAGATYGSNEQTMLQDVYSALRTFGFLS